MKEPAMHTRHIRTLLGGILLAMSSPCWGQQAAAPSPGDTAITPAMIARGDSIFHGRLAGGACFGCHGNDGKGVMGLAPDLTTGKWLNGDGSYAFIAAVVEKGVPHPKKAAAPMPAKGGAKLGPAEVRAVAAYVYSLTHPKPRSGP
jgi:mono/diheme cytochrome c family protein